MWWQRQCPDKPSSPASSIAETYWLCVSEGEITSRRWTDISKPLSAEKEGWMDGWLSACVAAASRLVTAWLSLQQQQQQQASFSLHRPASVSIRPPTTKTLLSGRLCWPVGRTQYTAVVAGLLTVDSTTVSCCERKLGRFHAIHASLISLVLGEFFIFCNCLGRLLQRRSFVKILSFWRPLLPYGYSYKASCARPG